MISNEFHPPIPQRSTEELLFIAGAPEKWQQQVVEQARAELEFRKVEPGRIQHAKYVSQKADRLEEFKKEKEAYDIMDFIFQPLSTTLTLLFYWEFKKDGLLKKAEQQKKFRLCFLILIVLVFLMTYL